MNDLCKKTLKGGLMLFINIMMTPFMWSQNINETLEITRIGEKIAIDGKVDEAVWQTVPTLPLTMHWPSYQGKITEKTEIRIAYDDEYIYLGAICHTSDPSEIQNTTFQRDNWNQKTDQMTLILDPYHDKENTIAFVVTPTVHG